MKYFLMLVLLFGGIYLQAQKDSETTLETVQQAVALMDAGEVDASIELLQAERKFQQDSYAVNYELGYAYYIKQDFKRATKYLKSILDHPEANERVYQLLGNALDDGGKPERALKVYQKGAVKYPDVASMHVEQGILEMKRQRYDAAAAHWEQGILADPNYASSYFHLANLYALTPERVWALLYGETFILLEPGSPRTEVISRVLFSMYNEAIEGSGDSLRLSFSKQMSMTVDDLTNLKLPFPMLYGTAMSLAATETLPLPYTGEVTPALLHELRANFLLRWDENPLTEDRSNPLFDYQRALREAGHQQIYNRWLLSEADEEGFTEWYNAHEEDFDLFALYIRNNPFTQTKENYLSRNRL